MHLGWPQAIYVTLILVSMGIALAKFGEPKRSTYGFGEVIVGPALAFGLLYWGGFFGG